MKRAENPARAYHGLYYYYLVMARTLSLLEIRTLALEDGTARHWANDLAGRLIGLQAADGSWTNPADRWWEGDSAVVTAYAVRALSLALPWLGPSGEAKQP
jgi:squalene-hopene/tetraprenyl-beta-curcumene cyclase